VAVESSVVFDKSPEKPGKGRGTYCISKALLQKKPAIHLELYECGSLGQ
jgi:hypothetical protein